MDESPLNPEVLEAIRQQILQEHPEMEGAEVTVSAGKPCRGSPDVAAKVGISWAREADADLYTVTLRKEVVAEDGVALPLVVRVTVDAEGRVVKRRAAR
ncbi:MAG: hypothetical protein ACP5SI_11280 [Chloroflexia bacterium]